MSIGKIILDYFKIHKLKALAIVLIVAIAAVAAILPAQVLRIIVDDAIPSKKAIKLLQISLVYVLTYVLVGVTTFIKDIIMLGTSQHIIMKIRSNMMKHIEKLSYRELVKTDAGSLEAYFNNDINSIHELFTAGVIDMITDSFKIIGIVVSIFIYSVRLGLVLLLILPFLILFTSIVRKKMLKAQLKTKKLEGNVNKMLLENVECIEQVKVNKAENYAKEKYDEILKGHFKANQASNFYDAIFSPIMQITRSLVICLVLLLSGYNANIFGLTTGMIISSLSLVTDLFSPIENLGTEIQTIQKSVAAVKRINSFFKMEKEVEKEDVKLNNFVITYDHVSFAYEEAIVIKDFNLVIKEGEKVAFQGPSGSGKSTLMKLALGLINPQKGSVTIGGFPNFKLGSNTRKDIFAIVYQEPFFSGGTIYEEITLLDNSITKEEVRKSLDEVGLGHITNLDIKLKPNEYSTGELALLNIARIIVKNSKIIFLDEMNAKIDPVTASNIIKLINKIAKDKTVISINHYGETLENARIIRLVN